MHLTAWSTVFDAAHHRKPALEHSVIAMLKLQATPMYALQGSTVDFLFQVS